MPPPTRNLASMMQKAKDIQDALAQAKQDLADQRFQTTAGGGAVSVEADGEGMITSLKLDPNVLTQSSDEDDLALLQDLILIAVNQVRLDAAQARTQKIKNITGGLSLGDLPLPPGLDLPL